MIHTGDQQIASAATAGMEVMLLEPCLNVDDQEVAEVEVEELSVEELAAEDQSLTDPEVEDQEVAEVKARQGRKIRSW